MINRFDMAKQTAVLKEVSVKGIGLHNGNKSVVVFKPAPNAEYDIRFVRTDFPNKFEIEAVWSNASSGLTVRGSVIENTGVRIYTIEHIMSACFALGIDNLIVEINNNEPPILNGSAKIFAEALLKGGLKEFDTSRKFYVLKEPVNFFEAGKTRISVYLPDQFEIECTIGFDHPFLWFQQMSLKDLNRIST
jgi:UDP-3-O-[3-hydroxymyristoyl] N-acetylglucosamine deacetylase/3-hydroxyacyl-[acyl-carrier-protein] dehydratase